MRLFTRPAAAALAVVAGAALIVGCGSSAEPASSASSTPPAAPASSSASAPTSSSAPAQATTVTITDNHGEVTVPVNPTKVVALDNHVFSTLAAWEVPLVAAPKAIMGKNWPKYTDDSKVLDIGSHREPKLEAIIEAQPELIIGGYRFSDQYADIKKQNPQAVIIEIAPRDGKDPGDELKRLTEILGKIFAKDAEAKAINDGYEKAVADAKATYNGSDTVIGLVVGGGKISYAAPGTGRSVGPVFTALGLKPAIDTKGQDNTHGDDISVEAIAASKAQWAIVLDRDAAVEEKFTPAKQLLEGSAALKTMPAVSKGQIVYLDPAFYLTEDIQAYTALYDSIAKAFSAAK